MTARAALGLILAALAAKSAAAVPVREVTFAPDCRAEGAPAGSRCGTLRVPEDRARPGGRQLSLRFVIAPGAGSVPADPIVYIAGGPGESALEALPLVLPTLRSVDPTRAVIFLDQRGTGGSNPLGCPGGLGLLTSPGDGEALRDCAARLRERADLDRYSSLDAAADLEDLRAALGYGRLNLVAVSYGVRVALLYMRGQPRRVRAAVLRAAYPLHYNIVGEGIAAADAALATLIDDCGRYEPCRAAYPNLWDQLRAIDTQLAAAPVFVTAEGADGAPMRLPVTREFFHHLLLVMMQAAPSRQFVPQLIATAAAAGFQPFAVPIAQLHAAFSDFPVGMYLSVLCAEDAPRPRSAAVPRTPLFATADKLDAICSTWPVRPRPPSALAPFTADTPTLIVSGALDPITPPVAASRLAASLRRSAHIVMPATGHGPMFPQCVRSMVAAFLRSAAARPLAGECDGSELAPFALPAAAPVPAPEPPGAPPTERLEGTWDLHWRTSRGTAPGGHLVIRRSGARIEAELHGRGSISASGTIEGDGFTLSGSSAFVSYRISGTITAEGIEGVLRVMSVERHFVGRRRPDPPAGPVPH